MTLQDHFLQGPLKVTVRRMLWQYVDDLLHFFIMYAMAHLSDDETVAKMGHPN
jgi:hypothetical protein